MKLRRRSKERGYAHHGWLESFHTFSFAGYYDPHQMGFGALRVINDDKVEPAKGFSMHSHHDMEILTYVLSGELEHKDSMGNSGIIKPGEVQRMSAGTGVRHSEFNASSSMVTHLLQIWILPEKKGIPPGYEQKSFENDLMSKNFLLVASREGKNGSVKINQDANVYVGKYFKDSTSLSLDGLDNRKIWIHNIKEQLKVAGEVLEEGDSIGLDELSNLSINPQSGSEFLMFDLPPV